MAGNEDEIKELEKHAVTEKADNELEFSRQLGKPVRYGQVIQLRNSLTKKYICADSTNAAKLDILNMAAFMNAENAKRLTLPCLFFPPGCSGLNLLLPPPSSPPYTFMDTKQSAGSRFFLALKSALRVTLSTWANRSFLRVSR